MDQETCPPVIEPALTECPHCGCDEFIIEFRVAGKIREHHRFDGQNTFNGDMWNGLRQTPLKKVTCADCTKPIAKLISA